MLLKGCSNFLKSSKLRFFVSRNDFWLSGTILIQILLVKKIDGGYGGGYGGDGRVAFDPLSPHLQEGDVRG